MKTLFLSFMAGVLCGISASAQSTLGGVYQVVTSTSDLATGDTIVLVSYDAGKNMYAMGTYDEGVAFHAIGIGTTTADYLPSTITLVAANTSGNVFEYRVGKYKDGAIGLRNLNNEYIHTNGISLTLSSSTSGSSHKWTPYKYLNENFAMDAVAFTSGSSNFISYIYSDSGNNFVNKNLGGIYNNTYMLAYCYKKLATNETLSIGSTGYATMYYSDRDVELPEGLTAYTMNVTKESGEYKLHLNNIGMTVPHGTAVVIRGAANTTYHPAIFSTAATTARGLSAVEGNMLYGTDDEALQSNGSGYYFKLADHATKGVGFYWGAEDGVAFTNKAHRAYLFLPNEMVQASLSDIPFSSLEEGSITLTKVIGEAKRTEATHYDLAGRKAQGRGLQISDGKKFIVK